MKIYFLPKMRLGKWSVGLIFLMPGLFYLGMWLANNWYDSMPAGETILSDFDQRPLLVLTMLSGMAAGIMASVMGLVAVIKQKERALLVYGSTLLGMLLILFLIGEVLFPH